MSFFGRRGQKIYEHKTILKYVEVIMIIDFSVLGSGDGKQVDLCPDCRYSLKIQYRGHVPQVAWLNGAQIMEQYGSQEVKITVRGIKGCVLHANNKGPAFLQAAHKSGIDISGDVDDYKENILKQRHPNARI